VSGDGGGWRFYGWRIVAVALVCQFVSAGLLFYSFGVFFKSVAAELGGSRFDVSVGLAAANVAGALSAPFIGRAVERGSARSVIILGSLACGSGYALLSMVGSLWQFYAVTATLVGVGTLALGNIPQAALVTRWFAAKRGTALGIATVGVSLSGLVMPTAATFLINGYGWRVGYRIYGAMAVVLVLPLVIWVVVDRPEDLGLSPDGDDAAGPMSAPRFTTREIMASRAFWCIALTFALSIFSVSAMLTHLVPHLTDIGLGPYRAASLLSLAAGCGIAGKVTFGRIADEVDPRRAVWLSLGLQVVGSLLLLSMRGTLPLTLAAIVFGFGMGGIVPLFSTLIAAAFGPDVFPRAAGLMRPVMLPLTASGVPLAGWLFDHFGNYNAAFITFAAAYAAAMVATAWLPAPPPRSGLPSPQAVRAYPSQP
jgi:MFS family permease